MPSDRRPQPSSSRADGRLAPPWHTIVLVALIASVAVTGSVLEASGVARAVTTRQPLSAGQRLLSVYLPLVIVNAAMALYVSRLFRTRNRLPELLGARWHSVRRAAGDLLLALLGVALISWLEAWLAPGAATGRNAASLSLLPSTVAERLTWAMVSLCVGFCEEVVYRGYLQQQLSAATRRISIGIVLQALLFGMAHLEQGPAAAARIALYGLLLGVLAGLRRSLLPGIACHIGIDLRSALL